MRPRARRSELVLEGRVSLRATGAATQGGGGWEGTASDLEGAIALKVEMEMKRKVKAAYVTEEV